MSGQGLGLRVQKAANSAAASFGRMTRFACWYAAHCPPVLPRHFAATGGGAHLGGGFDYSSRS